MQGYKIIPQKSFALFCFIFRSHLASAQDLLILGGAQDTTE